MSLTRKQNEIKPLLVAIYSASYVADGLFDKLKSPEVKLNPYDCDYLISLAKDKHDEIVREYEEQNEYFKKLHEKQRYDYWEVSGDGDLHSKIAVETNQREEQIYRDFNKKLENLNILKSKLIELKYFLEKTKEENNKRLTCWVRLFDCTDGYDDEIENLHNNMTSRDGRTIKI